MQALCDCASRVPYRESESDVGYSTIVLWLVLHCLFDTKLNGLHTDQVQGGLLRPARRLYNTCSSRRQPEGGFNRSAVLFGPPSPLALGNDSTHRESPSKGEATIRVPPGLIMCGWLPGI